MERSAIVLRSFFILLIAIIQGCGPSPETGTYTSVGKSSLKKYWKTDNIETEGDYAIFINRSASIISRFSVKNFELEAKIKTTPGAEGLIFIHANDSKDQLYDKGYRVYINNSDYRVGNNQKTGSLCNIRNNFVHTAADNEWFDINVIVRGNFISVAVNGKVISEYVEPETPYRNKKHKGMLLTEGYLAIEKVSEGGEIAIEDLRIMPLDAGVNSDVQGPVDDEIQKQITLLNQDEFPLIDFHCHLKGGLTMEQAREHGRKNGYNYGVAANCGLKFPVTSDSTLIEYLNSISDQPVFKAMQCEGREWVTLFSEEPVSRFDYIFTDAMTWTDHKGRRMRLWMPDEVVVENEDQFMDMLVEKIESVLSKEPVDIHVNPTFLPAELADDYDRLWTEERMDRVVKALKDNDVALEINSRFRLPGIPLIKKAKKAGVKFSFGTNNGSNDDLGRLEYCLEVIEKVGLTPEDMFLPRGKNDKKVMKMGIPDKITG